MNEYLNKSFKPVTVESFRLFLKAFSHSSLDFFITCELNSFEIFLENCKQSEVRWCQIQTIGRAWNSFKCDAVCHHQSGRTSVGFGVIMLKKHWFFV